MLMPRLEHLFLSLLLSIFEKLTLLGWRFEGEREEGRHMPWRRRRSGME
jgi:hypothetical protein